MAEELLKPRAAYESALQNRQANGVREAQILAGELAQYATTLEDHGYRVEVSDNLVAIRRGGLDIVRAVFNFGDSGKHRITNGIAEVLRQGNDLAIDVSDPTVARHEFKNQLRHATDLFYANKSMLEALGLA